MKTNNVESEGTWTTAEFHAEIARILAENSDLPVKVHVSGDLAMGVDGGRIGEIYGYGVSEYVEYEKSVYYGRDNEKLRDEVENRVWGEREREILNAHPKPADWSSWVIEAMNSFSESVLNGELDWLIEQRIAELDWKPCIWLYVGPCKDLEEGADVQKSNAKGNECENK